MKCLIFLNLIILVFSSSLACPSSKWFRFKNKCYLTDASKPYWFRDNVVFCKSQHATTVSIHSADENNFVKTKLIVYKPYWLGIRQVDFDNKTYEWLDGSPYNYSNWRLRVQKNCSGAYIFNGEWGDDTQSCTHTGYAICQIEIYSTIFKMLSQTIQETGNLNKEIKEVETRLKSTDVTFEDALNTQKDSLTAMSSEFHADLENTENRLSKWIEKLEDKINLMNLSMTLMNSDFELDLKNKEIQIKSTHKELVRQSLMMTRLENAIHTQNDLIARMRSTSESISAKN